MFEAKIKEKFIELFKKEPILVKSPGRINFIGEHTDYNNGYVLPASIDKYIYFALQKNSSKKIRIYSFNFNESIEAPIQSITKHKKSWANYLLGSYKEILNKDFKTEGFDCVFGGNIPLGAGLSSSASIVCGLLTALKSVFNLKLNPLQITRMGQSAENNFVGVQCGIMDQFAIVNSKKNKLMKLDCKTLDFSYHPFSLSDIIPILVNSKVKHSLASSEYNTRRKECETGVSYLKEKHNEISSLRDVSLEDIMEYKDIMPNTIFQRCLFVIEENNRVLEFCKALDEKDYSYVGELIYNSHKGLQNLYNVSCPELDFLVEEAMNLDYTLGSRMMGGGFGGCTLNLIQKDYKELFTREIKNKYQSKTGITADIYAVELTNGIEIINE